MLLLEGDAIPSRCVLFGFHGSSVMRSSLVATIDTVGITIRSREAIDDVSVPRSPAVAVLYSHSYTQYINFTFTTGPTTAAVLCNAERALNLLTFDDLVR